MYKVVYHNSGLPVAIDLDGMYIPLDKNNSDFQRFLGWNTKQSVPLNYKASIPAIPDNVPIVKETPEEAIAEVEKSTNLEMRNMTVYVKELERRVLELEGKKGVVSI